MFFAILILLGFLLVVAVIFFLVAYITNISLWHSKRPISEKIELSLSSARFQNFLFNLANEKDQKKIIERDKHIMNLQKHTLETELLNNQLVRESRLNDVVIRQELDKILLSEEQLKAIKLSNAEKELLLKELMNRLKN